MRIIDNVRKARGDKPMQKKTENDNLKISVACGVKDKSHILKVINKKVISAVLAAIILVASFGFITKYYTLGYDVYYGDINVGVISSKEEAIEAYTEAAADVKQYKRKSLEKTLSFVMTIAAISDIMASDIYRSIVEAAEGSEACYSIECDGKSIAEVKTKSDAENAINKYIAKFERDDAEIYTSYDIKSTRDIVTKIVSADEAAKIIEDSGLFTVVYRDVITEEVEIPYATTVIEDENILKGCTLCEQEGKAGKGIRKEIIFYENGVKKHSIDPVTETIEEPCEEIIRKGTGEMVGLNENTLPYPTEGRLSSPFGIRWGRNHTGMDIAADTGTPIYAPAGGVVTFSSTKTGYGNYIMIDHGNGYVTAYAHMDTKKVHEGDTVEKGDLIGTVGNTGRSTGPHLHFEVMVDGKYVDPTAYIAG